MKLNVQTDVGKYLQKESEKDEINTFSEMKERDLDGEKVKERCKMFVKER